MNCDPPPVLRLSPQPQPVSGFPQRRGKVRLVFCFPRLCRARRQGQDHRGGEGRILVAARAASVLAQAVRQRQRTQGPPQLPCDPDQVQRRPSCSTSSHAAQACNPPCLTSLSTDFNLNSPAGTMPRHTASGLANASRQRPSGSLRRAAASPMLPTPGATSTRRNA